MIIKLIARASTLFVINGTFFYINFRFQPKYAMKTKSMSFNSVAIVAIGEN